MATETRTFPINLRRCALVASVLLLVGAALPAASLRGSRSSIGRQNAQAQRHDFTFIRTPSQLRWFVDKGYLVRVPGNADYTLHGVSYPYARPEVKLFVERLGRQYRAACGERLVVTSLTRPRTRQPANASPRSVHPTGMALDIRRSKRSRCRRWLEGVLVHLEERRVLEASYERWPPHYHIAVFPKPYAAYVAAVRNGTEVQYRVRRGDTLYHIARRYDTTIARVKAANGLRSSRIYPGQVLKVPAGS